MADVSVRTARPDDVDEISRIQRETWRTAYAGFVPETVLAQVTPELGRQQWGAAVGSPPTPQHRVLVALEKDAVVGFVAFGPSTDDDAKPHTAAVSTMLVEPRWGRRGHGSRLLAAAVDHLRTDRASTATAWVLDRDRASTAFYTSAGWSADGTARALDAPGAELREIRLHTSLVENDPSG